MSANDWDKVIGWVSAIGLVVYFIIVMNGGI
jgi:hypothetical protein